MPLSPAPKGNPKAPRLPSLKGWRVKLTRPLSPRNEPGKQLRTLSDARAYLLRHCKGVTHSPPLSRTVTRLMTAADTGTKADREEATWAVSCFLISRNWL